MLRSIRRPLALLPVLAVLGFAALAGCAQRDDLESARDSTGDSRVTGDSAFPTTVTSPGTGREVSLPERPDRIVSLSPANTENLYAIGAGKQVVAVDEASDYPRRAPRTKLSGLSPNPQAIAGHQPDLVVASEDADDLTTSLGKLDIPTLIVPAAASLEQMYQQLAVLGAASGHEQQAERVARETREQLRTIVAKTPEPDRSLSYFHEVSPDFYTTTSNTFIGKIYQRFGLRNIADAAGGQAGDYPQLSAQRIVQADPDMIFLADTQCCGVTARKAAQRPGWDTLQAVRDGNVVELDDATASRWTPRIVQFASDVSEAVRQASGQG